MHLEGITTRKDNYGTISLLRGSKRVKLMEAERRMVVTGVCGEGDRELLIQSTNFSHRMSKF